MNNTGYDMFEECVTSTFLLGSYFILHKFRYYYRLYIKLLCWNLKDNYSDFYYRIVYLLKFQTLQPRG